MYSVASNLLLYGKLGPKLKKSIKEHNLKVMPLVVNTSFNQKIMHNLLLSPKAQDNVIKGLIYLAKKNNYIGWQYDFENISYLDKDLYTAFVERTYKSFKENDLLFSVTVVARYVDYEDTNVFKNWSGVYDFKKIADNSDFVSLMAYDDPKSVGPTASLDFVNKSLAYAKDKIPAEKLSFGVPLYYWKWNADTNKRIGSGMYKSVLAIMANVRHTVSFDAGLGVSCLSYLYNNKNYKVWFEDKNSFQAKLDIIKNNNLRGFSARLIGGEDPKIWSVLDQGV
jgi:spore germination protein YaaH